MGKVGSVWCDILNQSRLEDKESIDAIRRAREAQKLSADVHHSAYHHLLDQRISIRRYLNPKVPGKRSEGKEIVGSESALTLQTTVFPGLIPPQSSGTVRTRDIARVQLRRY